MLGQPKTVPIELIDPGEAPYPTDEVFIYLYQQHLLGALEATPAVIDRNSIEPHSSYRPELPTELVDALRDAIEREDAPLITVYPRGDRFIMSDDYSVFYAYTELGYEALPCLLLGPATGDGVRYVKST